MKTASIRHIILFYLLILAWGRVVRAGDIAVGLNNPPSTGTVAFALFDSANAFGDLRDPVKVVKYELDDRAVYRIEKVPPGEYALLVYYDENNNDRIDRNFIGIPTEPLGFSHGYQPKGPPNYHRAAFMLTEDESRRFDVKLYRPLGKRGRLGLGLGVIARSSPYRDYDGGVFQVIPAITYSGKRLRIYGPSVQLDLLGSGKLRLAATGKYRIGVYEESRSDFLEGMGDRKDTFMVGPALQAELPGGLALSADYRHDVLDEIGGGAVRCELGKSFQFGRFRFSPAMSLNWLSSKLSNNDFGVPCSKATPTRPAYDLDDTLSFEAGLGTFIEITRDWLIVMSAAVEFLDDEVSNSPIVSEDYTVKGFGAVSYLF